MFSWKGNALFASYFLFLISYLDKVYLFAQPLVHGLLDGAEDVLISRAAAEVAGEQLAQFVVAVKLARVQDLSCGHDEARGAESALDGSFVDKSLLDIGEFPVRTFQTFQCQDGLSFCPDSQVNAGVEGFPVDQNVAGAAFPDFTTLLDGSQMEVVSEHVGERLAGFGWHCLHAGEHDVHYQKPKQISIPQ